MIRRHGSGPLREDAPDSFAGFKRSGTFAAVLSLGGLFLKLAFFVALAAILAFAVSGCDKSCWGKSVAPEHAAEARAFIERCAEHRGLENCNWDARQLYGTIPRHCD